MECVRWGMCALWLPASPVSCPRGWGGGLVWHLCSPFKRSQSLVNRHSIRRALWPPDSWLLLSGRPEGRPFLILRRPESHRGARREMDGASGCGGPVATKQHLREKCPLPQD